MDDAANKGHELFQKACEYPEEDKAKKRWIRAKDGVERYSISRPKFISLAIEAGAAYKIDSVLLVDTEKFESYLENFRLPGGII